MQHYCKLMLACIHATFEVCWIPVSGGKKEAFKNKSQMERMLPLQMKWPCGWMYMWVQAARSCEWEVATEWEEKSCFSETICTGACWKAVTLQWLLFVFCTCANVVRSAVVGKRGFYVYLPLSVHCVCVCVSIIIWLIPWNIIMFRLYLQTHTTGWTGWT